ncbi:MAG: hypothetical protein KJZ78_05475 [Bryobacteraceae bacterium]|nr:hypothetical protein [Bryobacteraceae bacterium]
MDFAGVKLRIGVYDEKSNEAIEGSLDMVGGKPLSFNFAKPELPSVNKAWRA